MTTPTQGEHAQTEALFYASALENCAEVDFDRIFVPAAAVIRRLHAQVAALTAPPAQPAAPQCVAYAELDDAFESWLEDQDVDRLSDGYESWLNSVRSCWDSALRASHRHAPAGAPSDVLAWRINGRSALGHGEIKGAWIDGAPTTAQIEDFAKNAPSCTLQYAYATAQAAPAAERENLELRRMLCIAHAGAAAYMDDGEAQDNRELPLIDFLHDTPAEIQDKLQRRALKKLAAQAAAPTPAAQADSQPAPQGETNVQLDTDSNPSAPGQHRDMAGSVALGQPMGHGQDQAAGHSGAQGDKLLTVAERNIRSFLRSAIFKSESDREAALSCVDVLRDAARAQADSVLEDAAPQAAIENPYRAMTGRHEAFEQGVLKTLAAFRAKHAARKQGGKHD